MNFQALIAECENDLRAGRLHQAANRLRPLQVTEIPRPMAQAMAGIFRRAHLETFALRVTTPIIVSGDASTGEIVEHAASLIQMGAVSEGLEYLQNIKSEEYPEVLFHQAQGHAHRYEFAQAVPLLRLYNDITKDSHFRSHGLRLLAKAHINMKDDASALEVCKRLEETMPEAAAAIRAQIHIKQRNFAQARQEIQICGDAYVIQKWSAVIQALESGSTQPLSEFKARAHEHKDWEFMRELDRYSLQLHFDEEKHNHLLFGTPYSAYRDQVISQSGREWTDENYVHGAPEAPAFILHTGEFKNFQADAPSKMVHQLLAALLRDFYRPWSIGALFAELFPGEHFDVFSSPNRVHQLLWRLRKWAEVSHLPIELVEHNGLYSLHKSDSFAFVVPREGLRVDENVLHLRQLQSHFRNKPSFTPREAQACLNISASSFKRLAQWGLKEQKLRREGASRATVYKLVG